MSCQYAPRLRFSWLCVPIYNIRIRHINTTASFISNAVWDRPRMTSKSRGRETATCGQGREGSIPKWCIWSWSSVSCLYWSAASSRGLTLKARQCQDPTGVLPPAGAWHWRPSVSRPHWSAASSRGLTMKALQWHAPTGVLPYQWSVARAYGRRPSSTQSDILALHIGNQASDIILDQKWNSLTFPIPWLSRSVRTLLEQKNGHSTSNINEENSGIFYLIWMC